MAIRLMIIGDQLPLPRLVQTAFRYAGEFDLVGNVVSLADAIVAIEQTHAMGLLPEVVLISITETNADIFSLMAFRNQRFPALKVVILTDSFEAIFLIKLLQLNVQGCLSHQLTIADLHQAIRSVCQGYHKLDAIIVKQILPQFLKGDFVEALDTERQQTQNLEEAYRFSLLSARELKILELIAAGANNQEISQQLFLAQKTVKNHMTRIFKKLKIQNRTQAAIIAKKYGRYDSLKQED
jgi:DNA-binding NarL/FixJ family response regulator